MPTYKTRGIIINRHNLGEADRIITILSEHMGVIRAVAKGVRKIKSRMAGHLELFSEAELMLAKGRNLDVIISARLQRHTESYAAKDYEHLRLAFLCAEMIDKLSGERIHHGGQFEVAHYAFAALDQPEFEPIIIELWFRLRLLDSLGYKPELDGCVICGASSPDNQYAFNNDVGGIVDEVCRTATSLPLSHDQIKLWRLALTHGIASLQKVAGNAEIAQSSLPILSAFYEHTFGRTFRSQEMLA